MSTFIVKYNRDFHCLYCEGRIDPRNEFVLMLNDSPKASFSQAVRPAHTGCYVANTTKKTVNRINEQGESNE